LPGPSTQAGAPGGRRLPAFDERFALLLASDVSILIAMTFPVWVLVMSGLLLARTGLLEELRVGKRSTH